MMIKKALLIAVSLTLGINLSACNSGATRSLQFMEESAPVKKVAEFERHTLEHDKAVQYVFSEKSDASNFETGKSYGALFELPEFKDASTVEVKSYCDCLGLYKNVFIPIGVLLDEGFNRVGEIKFVTHSQTMWEPVHFVSEVALDKNDRYVLIYSDPRRYGKPADSVSADVVHVRTERMDYIKKGTVMQTYTDAKAGVWWKGAAVGEIQILVKSPKK
ncbi:MAG: hypothetical protein ABII81_06125 [Pseudomonadota bacterium]